MNINKSNRKASCLLNRRGNALMLVLILFMVMSILSLAMLAVASVEHTQILAEEKIDQAYYTAHAVVDATAKWIGSNYNARDQMLLVVPGRAAAERGKLNAYTTTDQQLDGKPYDLFVWRDETDPDKIFIQAKAYYGTSTADRKYFSSVQLSLEETISSMFLFEDAIYSEGPFGKSSGSANLVTGSVGTGSDSIPANLNVSGAKTVNKQFVFFDVTPPTTTVWDIDYGSMTRNNLEILNNTPNGNVRYDALKINGSVYIKNTNSAGDPMDVHILVDDLDISESAIIYPQDNDGGRIFIYVTTNIFCDKKFGIGGNDAHPIVYLVCNGVGTVNFSGNPCMNVYLYGPDVDVEYGGTTVFNGAIIANVYGWNGNITVTYRPPDLTDSPFSDLADAQVGILIAKQTWLKD